MINKHQDTKISTKCLKYNKGFTLIELLVSISILSLLLFVGSYSYSLMSNRWNKELGNFNQVISDGKKLMLTQRLLEGIQTFVVIDNKKTPSFFFIGKSSSLLAVSRSGLFNSKYPMIVRLTVVKKENGLVDLLYQSLSTQKIVLVNINQQVEFDKSYILLSDFESISFKYFGWRSSDDKIANATLMPAPEWFDTFSGIDAQLMPVKLAIMLKKQKQHLTIPINLDAESELRLSPYNQVDE